MLNFEKHKYIQIIIKGIRECLSTPTAIIKDEHIYNFKSLNHQNFETFRSKLGITSDHLKWSMTDEYIIKESSFIKKRLIFFNNHFNLVIKSIKKREKDFILSIFPTYSDYVTTSHDTLLSKILMCVKVTSNSRVSYIIVMNNVLPYEQTLYELYDLKGSTYNRVSNDSTSTLKDLDWIYGGRKLFLQGKRVLLKKQIIADCKFLKSLHILDYSIIIGIQNGDTKKKNLFKRYLNGVQINEEHLKKASFNNSIFFRDFGGYSSEIENKNEIYYIGIIDFLTHWTWAKKLEKLLGDCCCKSNISCVNPKEYNERFIDMVENRLFYN